MANLNEAFNLNYSPRNTCRIPQNLNPSKDMFYNKQNVIGLPFCGIDNAFDRVKISNSKYDTMTRDYNKHMYGYVCQICRGPVNYHMMIQDKYPHDFIKGEYRPLTKNELSYLDDDI